MEMESSVKIPFRSLLKEKPDAKPYFISEKIVPQQNHGW